MADLYKALIAASVPSSPINSVAQVMEDPQVLHRKILADVTFDGGPTFKLVGNPIRYTERPITDYPPPPELGQHTDDILGLADFSTDEIASLRSQHII